MGKFQGFSYGQMGSAHCKTAASVIPPQGMVIVAVQFLAANTPTILRSEKTTNALVDNADRNACFSTEHVAHNNGDAQQAIADGSSNTTRALTGANAAIKVGMQVFSNTENLLVDGTLVAERSPCLVTYIDGTEIRFNRPVVGATTTLTFSELHGTGDGGEDASGIAYPANMTIYGRWLEVKPEADANGGVICYFGK